MNPIAELKAYVKENRKSCLQLILVASLAASLLNLLIGQVGLNTIGILILLGLNFIISTYFAYMLKKELEPLRLGQFITMLQRYGKGIGFVFLIQVAVIAAWFTLLYFISHIDVLIMIAQPLTLIGFVLLNMINFKMLFNAFDDRNPKILKDVFKKTRGTSKMIFYLLLKTIALLLLGSVTIYLVNVFVYAPQIDMAIKSATVVTDELLNPYFSSPLSNFIQSFGAQLVSGLILIWIGSASLVLTKKGR